MRVFKKVDNFSFMKLLILNSRGVDHVDLNNQSKLRSTWVKDARV